MSALLSVDPGTKSAWALWLEDDDGAWVVRAYGRVSAPDAVDAFTLLGTLAREYGIDWPGSTLVVEGQWFDGGRRSTHFRAVERLIESRCGWQDAALIAGAAVEVVSPGRWMRAVSKGAPGEDAAGRVRAVCERVLPGCVVSEDEAAALMLGLYWLRQSGRRVACRRVVPMRAPSTPHDISSCASELEGA